MSRKRMDKLRKLMTKKNIDAVFIHSFENYQYLSGFNGSNANLLITQESALFFTDQRYTIQAKEQTAGYEVIVYGTDQFELLKKYFARFNINTIGYESMAMTVDFFQKLQKNLSNYIWEPLTTELLDIRKIKDEEEIKRTKEAIAISDQVFADLIPIIRPGMTEKEVLIELEYLKMKLGNEAPAFGTIVASDKRAALPHAQASNNEVKMNDVLLIDYGVTHKGYMSDMTRTICVGQLSNEMQKIYDLVMAALEEAVAAVRPGVTAHQLDAVAREVFLDASLEEYSLRGLGHGVGLQIHENPRVVIGGKEIIEENMIFTIEPGLYIPDKGGVRIEDMVLVTKDGCEVLTNTNRHIQLSILT